MFLKLPVAFEAEPKDSLIGDFLTFKPSFNVSNTNFVSFIVAALSNAPNTFTFSLSVKLLALKILLVYNNLAFNKLTSFNSDCKVSIAEFASCNSVSSEKRVFADHFMHQQQGDRKTFAALLMEMFVF